MPKSQSHKRLQNKAAGKDGRTDVRLQRNQFLDALTKSGNIAKGADPTMPAPYIELEVYQLPNILRKGMGGYQQDIENY